MVATEQVNFKVKTIDITPEVARQLLARNSGNRPVRQMKVDQFAAAMARGEWSAYADPGLALARLPDGTTRLQNGQHRLLAVVQSGVTLPGIQVREATIDEAGAREQYARFDQGANRSVADALGSDTQYTSKDLSVVSTALASIELLLRQGHKAFRSATIAQRAAIFRDHPADTAFALRLRREIRIAGKRLPTGMIMAAIETRRASPEDAEEFWKQVGEGALLVQSDPTFLLRELISRNYGIRSGGSGTTASLRHRAQALTAWKHFLARTTISKIIVRDDDLLNFPVARPGKGRK